MTHAINKNHKEYGTWTTLLRENHSNFLCGPCSLHYVLGRNWNNSYTPIYIFYITGNDKKHNGYCLLPLAVSFPAQRKGINSSTTATLATHHSECILLLYKHKHNCMGVSFWKGSDPPHLLHFLSCDTKIQPVFSSPSE